MILQIVKELEPKTIFFCSLGAGAQIIPMGQILSITESYYHSEHLLQVSEGLLWTLILHRFFHYFVHVYSPRARADNLRWQKFYANIEFLLLRPFLWSFIMILQIAKELKAKHLLLYIDKCHNSVMNYRNLPINNPKRDIVGTNALKIEWNPFINT